MVSIEEVAKAGYEVMHAESKWKEITDEGIKEPWKAAAGRVMGAPDISAENLGEFAFSSYTGGHGNWSNLTENTRNEWKRASLAMRKRSAS